MTTPAREQTRARYPDECGYAERDGVRVYYEAYGEGGPLVLEVRDAVCEWNDGRWKLDGGACELVAETAAPEP